ncbi:hypothetical protein EDD16DRAFT_1655525 [Pisolithus croceorrhizus]|nr:hypothetical protein EDD16DRAFT_1655525 [Pisolithus croceorrhizus]
MEFVWNAIGSIVWVGDCPDYLKEHQLWLSIIEGDVDDDLWLRLLPNDWLDAQSALRRRVTLQRYPPATARNEKVRSATPEQRISAIAWLIVSSKGVAELFASHGRTPPTFRTPKIAGTLSGIIGLYWGAFPSHNDAWENVLKKSKEDGCICSLADCRGMRQWFNMMAWLEDMPPNLEIGYEPCVRCRSLLKSRYEDFAANCTVTSHVSLLDAICNIRRCSRKPRFSSSQGPAANLLVNRMLEPLMRQHDFDVRYLPSVNRYPTLLRQCVAKLLRPQNHFQEVKFTDEMFDGVLDPWVVLGIIGLATCRAPAGKGTDSHNGAEHSYFSSFLRHSLECFDMPMLPQLSSTGLMLCHTLDQDCFEEYSFSHLHRAIDDDSDWVKSDQDGRQLRLSTAVMVAVTTFLHNKDVGLYGCRRCRNICMESFAGTSSAVWFEVANSRERAGLGPSSAHIHSEDDVLGGDHPSPFQGSLDIGMQEPAGMEAFTTYLHDPTLSKDEVQLQIVAGFLKLRQYIESYGFDASDCFRRSDGDNRPRLEHIPGHGTSSSKLSKSDKVEVIKGKLLEMLSRSAATDYSSPPV